MPPFGDGFKADGDMLPVPVCHGGFAVNGIVALGIICPPVRTPAFFSGEGTFQHGTAQKRKGARQFADFLNARFQCLCMQNIVIALGIKSVFLVLGALGMAGMWEAVFGDVGVTIIAVLNAMRILKK